MPLASPYLRGILAVHVIAGELDAALCPEDLAKAVRDRRAELTLCQHNLVVDTGLKAYTRFLGGNRGTPEVGGLSIISLSDLTVSRMVLGNTVNPPSPTPADATGVYTLLYTPTLAVSYPTNYSIMFSGLVPAGVAAGVTFTEEALMLSNGLVFAKTTFLVPKRTGYSVQFSHQISTNRE